MEIAVPFRRLHGSLVLDHLVIAAVVLAGYAALMYGYPIIYGGDTVIRLVSFPKIVYGHQLPLLEILIYGTLRGIYAPGSIFMLMASISAVSSAGIYMLAAELTADRRTGRLAALLYATHPFILYYSRVPYQEPLLFSTVAWGFYFLFRPPSRTSLYAASLLVGAACFSRYEGWIAALTAAMFYLRARTRADGRFRPGAAVKSIVIFGWAPALWIAWNGGLSPAGTYVVDLQLSWGRLYRSYFIGKSALWWSESAVVMMATAGLIYSLRNKTMRRDPRFQALWAMMVLYSAALVVSGHGLNPDPVRILTEREAFVPIAFLVLYAAIGGRLLAQGFAGMGQHGRTNHAIAAAVVLAAAVGYSIHRGVDRIAAANADPDLKTDYEVARFLAARGGAGLVFAAPLPEQAIQEYLGSAEKWGGPRGKEHALGLLNDSETTPLDYQRILAYSWLGKNRVFSADRIPGLDRTEFERFLYENRIEHVVVLSDFIPAKPYEKAVVGYVGQTRPEFEARNGRKVASVYAVRHEDAMWLWNVK